VPHARGKIAGDYEIFVEIYYNQITSGPFDPLPSTSSAALAKRIFLCYLYFVAPTLVPVLDIVEVIARWIWTPWVRLLSLMQHGLPQLQAPFFTLLPSRARNCLLAYSLAWKPSFQAPYVCTATMYQAWIDFAVSNIPALVLVNCFCSGCGVQQMNKSQFLTQQSIIQGK